MNNYLLDTNVIIDACSAKILQCLNYKAFYVSQVVFKEEIIKQVPGLTQTDLNILNESFEELINAQEYHNCNKKISFYDALNLSIAKERKMILVTGDQQLIRFARQEEVKCIGTLKLIEYLIENKLIDINGSINALNNLKLDLKRRVPHSLINEQIEKLQKTYESVK